MYKHMSYCVKCKKVTGNINPVTTVSKNNRAIMKSKCLVCGSIKSVFIKQQRGGKLDLHAAIGKLPKPKGGWTLPNHKYTGPYNPLELQLDANDKPLAGQEPFNQVDAIALKHDICYRDNENDKAGCDKKMLDDLNVMKPNGLREAVDKKVVQGIVGVKHKLGLGKNYTRRLAKH